MENKKRSKEPVIDFDVVRAMNEYIDDSFLNKALQSLRGGNKPDTKDVITYKINNTNYLANLYQDTNRGGGGKKSLLLDSIFKVPENFSLNSAVPDLTQEMETLDIGGAKAKGKPKAAKPKAKPKTKTATKKKNPKKKGGTELYEVEYSDVEELGGESTKQDIITPSSTDFIDNETGGARKKKPGRKPKASN